MRRRRLARRVLYRVIMNATSLTAGDERTPSRWLAAVATLALMTLLAMPRPARGAGLDVATLRVRLHDTAAIGLVAKLGLKHDIERLLDGLADFHAGHAILTLDDLHREYDRLVVHTVALLENGERDFARELAVSSEHIWTELTDPDRFAALTRAS